MSENNINEQPPISHKTTKITADTKIIYVITIGVFCGVMAYIAYYTKKSLDGLK